MATIESNSTFFKFQYLPDYAKFLLEKKLDEFTLVGIRFCREEDLPMMRPLSKLSEAQLVEISKAGNKEMLEALSTNEVFTYIEKNIEKFLNNDLTDLQGKKILENTEVVAEDIILAFYVRRKAFSFFLHSYTQNAVVHTLIIAEVDAYCTREHLLTTKAFIKNQTEPLAKL
jgi:hypothetical protein